MEGSARAAIAADEGRGQVAVSVPEDYRVILPPLPTGDAMKRAVVLHCDVAGRPYRIEDFRQPLEDAGVIKDVSGIGAYQMSHVWLVNLKSDEAKRKLVESAQLVIKGRTCLVLDPTRQELRLKLHWVAFDVSNETIRKAFSAYGEVKDVTLERWKVPGFDGAESTTRVVRIVLRQGLALERLPHLQRLGSGTSLVVVPGRAPLCLRCRMSGHIRRHCRVPKCTECRSFGHVREDCVRSYAQAAGRSSSDDQSELVMDEDEAETAAAPSASQPVQTLDKPGSTNVEADHCASQEPAGSAPPRPRDANADADLDTTKEVVSQEPSTPGATNPVVESESVDHARKSLSGGENASTSDMDGEVASAKRRYDEVLDAAGKEQRLRQIEHEWKVQGGKKKRGRNQPRSASLTRGDALSQ